MILMTVFSGGHVLRFVDCLVVALAFYLYAVYGTQLPQDRTLVALSLTAMFLDLLTVNRLRTREECPFVIQGAGNGALLPNAPPGARTRANELVIQGAEELGEYVDSVVPLWVVQLVLAVGAAACVLALLYQFRHIRLKAVRLQTRRRKVVGKSHVLQALAALAAQALARLRFEISYLRHRKTPQGLLVLAERTGRRLRLCRGPGESPGAYLRRLAEYQGMEHDRGQVVPAGQDSQLWQGRSARNSQFR